MKLPKFLTSLFEDSDPNVQLEQAQRLFQRGEIQKACQKWQQLAEQGNLHAQLALANLYQEGQAVPQDLAQARFWFEKAANQHEPYALAMLGYLYHQGLGVVADTSKAFHYYEQAAELDNAFAQKMVADFYLMGEGVPQESQRAFHYYQRAADQGNELAQYQLAQLYFNGWGVEQSYPHARAWFQSAAKTLPDAQLRLAEIYRHGLGIEPSESEAQYWLKEAAEAGHPVAQFEFGKIFEADNNEQSQRSALQWYELAVAQHYAPAQQRLGLLYWQGHKLLSIDLARAEMLLRGAADQGIADAQYSLAQLLAEKADPDWAQIAYWYQTAHQQGHLLATHALGQLAEKGLGVPQDYHFAATCYQQGMEAHLPESMLSLGLLYLDGKGVEKKPLVAVALFEQASEQSGIACLRLGKLYFEGVDLIQDYQRAREWLEKAAFLKESDAYYYLALLALRGLGQAKSVPTALKYLEQAHHQNQFDASLLLANLYREGIDVERNLPLAERILLESAEAGNLTAKLELAHRYMTGKEVKANPKKAAALFRDVAEAGDSSAQNSLAYCYFSGQGVAQDFAEAAAWWQKAAEAGDSSAQYNLALLYQSGQGVTADNAQFARWLIAAADNHFSDAQYYLGQCYHLGQGVAQDSTRAQLYLRAAAHQNNALAERYLGEIALAKQEFIEAAGWFEKAANHHDGVAQYQLAKLYLDGKGVIQDKVRATMWLQQAKHTPEIASQVKELLWSRIYRKEKAQENDEASAETAENTETAS